METNDKKQEQPQMPVKPATNNAIDKEALRLLQEEKEKALKTNQTIKK